MYDFGGWATKYNIACSDGRTIMHGAFKHQDNSTIPLVWNHCHDEPANVIGNATLTHRDNGVYAMCKFNDTANAEIAKNLVKHGDVTSLSIYANKLKQNGGNVMHGQIRELSLVLAGANPGAHIEEVLMHGDDEPSEATIYNDEVLDLDLTIAHSDDKEDENVDEVVEEKEEVIEHSEEKEEVKSDDNEITVAEVYETLNEDQKKAVAVIIDQLLEQEGNNEEESDMKHNVFDNAGNGEVIKHADMEKAVLKDVKKIGSLKEAVLAHAGSYGVEDIETLFPDATLLNNEPGFVDRDQTWVSKFLGATKKTPFSRIKVIHADITADPARAKGYTKGGLKKEEVFSLLKRTTEPTTVYKKQKLDRDDIIDITSFDVVAWMKREMRGKLEEELARAMLIGDGRNAASEDKIKETCIRPILTDSDLYTIKHEIPEAEYTAEAIIDAVIESKVDYEGTGLPNFYTTEEVLAKLRLIKDSTGRYIYESVEALARTMGVKEIITVPVMKNVVRPTTDSKVHSVVAILANPSDYMVGADKGGQVAMFDDFDIDYNQQKYLIETRCSGALTEPKTAIVIEKVK